MDFQKIMKEKQVTIPADNFSKSANPDAGVIAWSGWVLVVSSRAEEAESISDTMSIFPTQA